MTTPLNIVTGQSIKQNILNGLDESASIYRFIKTKHFLNMIKEKALLLRKPDMWDDPFENFLSNTIATKKNGEKIGFDVTNDFVGQCWTLREECDGIWKAYSSLCDGVRIESNVLKLLNLIYESIDVKPHINIQSVFFKLFIGKVIYYNDADIKKHLSDYISNIIGNPNNRPFEEIPKMLLIKRMEFLYEDEVRLLYSDESLKNEKIFKLTINPIDFIDSIKFAPKMCQYRYNSYKKLLIDY